MEKITKINEFKEEIDAGLENIALDISDSLLSKIQDIVLKAYEEKDIDTLEEYLTSINDMLIADYSDINFLNDVFEDGQLSTKDIECCMCDFLNFVEYELEERFEFINGETLQGFATEKLNNEIFDGNITEELARMIDLSLYCDYLEHLGYVESENGILYTY